MAEGNDAFQPFALKTLSVRASPKLGRYFVPGTVRRLDLGSNNVPQQDNNRSPAPGPSAPGIYLLPPESKSAGAGRR